MAERARAAALAALLCALALGCEAEPTRIVVVADSDLEIPAALDVLRFAIDARDMGGDLVVREVALDPERISLPLVLPVLHAGGALGPITITVAGMLEGAPVVERTARLFFVPGRSLMLHVVLEARCVALRETCAGEQTCVAGACASVEVDPGELPPWNGRGGSTVVGANGDGAALALDGGMSDAGAPGDDAGAELDAWAPSVDATTADASTCAAGCPCEQRCESGCECRDGCACTLSCASGGDCADVRCDRPGTQCAVHAAGASNLAVRCEHGARCVIDARDVSNATPIECRDDSQCELDCTGASNCELRCEPDASCLLRCGPGADEEDCMLDCRGTAATCDGGVLACNRGCP